MPPLQGAWVQSLVGELRFHMLHSRKIKKLGDNIGKPVSKGSFRVAGCQISQILALYLGHTTQLAGSQFPHEGLHLDPSSENSQS